MPGPDEHTPLIQQEGTLASISNLPDTDEYKDLVKAIQNGEYTTNLFDALQKEQQNLLMGNEEDPLAAHRIDNETTYKLKVLACDAAVNEMINDSTLDDGTKKAIRGKVGGLTIERLGDVYDEKNIKKLINNMRVEFATIVAKNLNTDAQNPDNTGEPSPEEIKKANKRLHKKEQAMVKALANDKTHPIQACYPANQAHSGQDGKFRQDKENPGKGVLGNAWETNWSAKEPFKDYHDQQGRTYLGRNIRSAHLVPIHSNDQITETIMNIKGLVHLLTTDHTDPNARRDPILSQALVDENNMPRNDNEGKLVVAKISAVNKYNKTKPLPSRKIISTNYSIDISQSWWKSPVWGLLGCLNVIVAPVVRLILKPRFNIALLPGERSLYNTWKSQNKIKALAEDILSKPIDQKQQEVIRQLLKRYKKSTLIWRTRRLWRLVPGIGGFVDWLINKITGHNELKTAGIEKALFVAMGYDAQGGCKSNKDRSPWAESVMEYELKCAINRKTPPSKNKEYKDGVEHAFLRSGAPAVAASCSLGVGASKQSEMQSDALKGISLFGDSSKESKKQSDTPCTNSRCYDELIRQEDFFANAKLNKPKMSGKKKRLPEKTSNPTTPAP